MGVWYQELETGMVESLELRKRDEGVAKEKAQAFEWTGADPTTSDCVRVGA